MSTPPIITELESHAARVGAAADYLMSPMIVAELREAVKEGIAQNDSPFVDTVTAAARWYCSESEIARAAAEGILTKLKRGGHPMYEKQQGDDAIRQGRWKPAQIKVFKKAAKRIRTG
jgi:hypothetical protein